MENSIYNNKQKLVITERVRDNSITLYSILYFTILYSTNKQLQTLLFYILYILYTTLHTLLFYSINLYTITRTYK